MEFWVIYIDTDGLWYSLPVNRRVWMEWRHELYPIDGLADSLTICLEY